MYVCGGIVYDYNIFHSILAGDTKTTTATRTTFPSASSCSCCCCCCHSCVTSCRYCCCCYCSAVVVFCLFFFVPLSILFARRNFSALSIFPAIISGSSSLSSPSSLHPFPLSSLHLLMVLTVLVSFCNIYRLAIYFSFSLLHSRRAAELPICLPFCDSLCRPHGVVEGCLRGVVARTVANDTKQRLWQSFVTCPAAAATGHH